MDKRKKRELIYGEITGKGMRQFRELEPNCKSFIDVGSGYGKFVWVMADFFDVEKVIGIEIDFEKYKSSLKHFNSLKSRHKIKFEYGDFRLYKTKIKEIEVVYCNCITWYLDTINELVDCLGDDCRFYHNNKLFYEQCPDKQEIVDLDMSWTSNRQSFYKLNTKDIR